MTQHPWIAALRVGLDALEKTLLAGDPQAVERASQHNPELQRRFQVLLSKPSAK